MIRRTFLLLLAALFLLTACRPAADGAGKETAPADGAALRAALLEKAEAVTVSAETVTFENGNGEWLTLPKGPQKTVILYASLTTLWYEAGGRASGCLGGSAATALYREQIGRDITEDAGTVTVAESPAAGRWDVERILATRPDLILCTNAMSGYATVDAPARAAGIPVVVMEYHDFSDYLKWFKVCCHLTGHPELWETVAQAALDEVVNTLLACRGESAPTVLCLFTGVDTLRANTENTVPGGMLAALGAVNAVPAVGETEHVTLDPEAMLAADPDMILIQCHTGEEDARALVARLYGESPVWQSLRAVREGRVYYLDKALFHNKPNRRFAEAYRTLAVLLYPEKQAELAPKSH